MGYWYSERAEIIIPAEDWQQAAEIITKAIETINDFNGMTYAEGGIEINTAFNVYTKHIQLSVSIRSEGNWEKDLINWFRFTCDKLNADHGYYCYRPDWDDDYQESYPPSENDGFYGRIKKGDRVACM